GAKGVPSPLDSMEPTRAGVDRHSRRTTWVARRAMAPAPIHIREAGPMAEVTARYLGLDVHKHTIAVAIAETSGPPELYGVIPNDPKVVRGLVEKLGQGRPLLAAYEAGPTGFVLQRQLRSLGVEGLAAAVPVGVRGLRERGPAGAGRPAVI